MSSADEKKWRKHVKSIGSLVALIMVITSARSTLADHYTVPTGSMEPTIHVGDRILVNKLAFGLRLPFTSTYLADFGMPARGDVVVLQSPVDGRTLVKRVVGLPGEQVEVRRGHVYVDSEPVDEAHAVVYGPGRDFGPETIPDGHFLVLGDNRPNSLDGRYFGYVDKTKVHGKAERVYFRDSGFTWEDL